MTTLLRNALVLMLPLFLLACGESGSEPEQFSEVRYQVSQAGGGTFSLLSLSSGGFQRRIPADAVYSAQGPVSFLIEGAPGPYFAEFCRLSGGDMTVSFTADSSTLPGQVNTLAETAGQSGVCRSSAALCTPGSGGKSCMADDECNPDKCEKRVSIKYFNADNPPLSIQYQPASDASATDPFADPDVRFEVCVPLSGNSACSVADLAGNPPTPNTIFGRSVTGSVGDIEATFLVGDPTPAVYFLNSAKHNAAAIFRAAADEFLQSQLFVNNTLRDTQAGTKDVVIRKDL